MSDQKIRDALSLCRELISSIEIMEEYPAGKEPDRFWAMTASTWLYPDGGVAYVGSVSKLKAAIMALETTES